MSACLTALVSLAIFEPSSLRAHASSPKRKVIIDQDCSGPATTNTNSVLALLAAEEIEVLGVTIPTGDAWGHESILHCFGMVQMLGLEDKVPVISGAAFPIVNSQEEAAVQFAGRTLWTGAFSEAFNRTISPAKLPEFAGKAPPDAPEFDFVRNAAAAFMIEQVAKYPGEVSILELAPPSNLAAAYSMAGEEFTKNVRDLWMTAGSLDCKINPTNGTHSLCDDPDLPRHEFNFWFDPEATLRVLRVPWGAGEGLIRLIPADVAFIPLWYDSRLASAMTSSDAPAIRYIATCQNAFEADFALCDEFASISWLLASGDGQSELLAHGTRTMLSVNVTHGLGYGETLTWPLSTGSLAPSTPSQLVREVLLFRALSPSGLDLFYERFLDLLLASSRYTGKSVACSPAVPPVLSVIV